MGNNTGCGSHKKNTGAKQYFNSKRQNSNENSINEQNNINNNLNQNINNNPPSQNNDIKSQVEKKDSKKEEKTKDNKEKYSPKEDIIKNDVSNFKSDSYSTNISLSITLKGIQEDTPYIVELLEYENIRKKNYKSIGKTLPVSRDKENNMVKYPSNLVISYHFSQNQPLEFLIFSENQNIKTKVEVSLGEIIGSNGQKYRRNFNSGMIFEVEATLAEELEKELLFDVRVEGILTGMKISYEIISLGSQFDPVNKVLYESESLENNSKIIFNKISIPLSELAPDENFDCNLVEIKVKDLLHGNILAKYSGNLSQLIQEEDKTTLEISSANRCYIKCLTKNFYSLLDYLNKNFHIYTTFSIDFSENNGRSDSPSSLHYHFGNEGSYYESMLKSCLSVLNPYADDSFYHIYAQGFNFINNESNLKDKEVFNEKMFPINLKMDNPSIEINNISKVYKDFLKQIKPIKNINLSYTLQFFENKIKEDIEGFEDELNEYNVLIYLVGGDPDDKEDFIEGLISCSNLPLSIIVIGLGKGPFLQLENIEDNFMNFKNKEGEQAKRKCFKFVSYNNCGKNLQTTTKNAVVELPSEIIDFLTLNNICPKD